MATKKLSDLHENHANQFLINETDFNNVKYHIRQTVNIEETNEEKAAFLDKVLEDLENLK